MTLFSKLLLGLAFLFIQFGVAPASLADQSPPENCAERPYDKGRLWKVSKGDAVPSYIFGTMHSKDPRILHLPGVIMQVFMASNTAVFETSLKDDELARNKQMMLLAPGQSLKEKIGDTRFIELSQIAAAYGMPPATLDRVKVWAAAAIISQPPPTPQSDGHTLTLLDKELEKSARQSGKRVIALETNAEQLSIFDSMSDTVQLEYLDQAIDENHRLNEELETMTSYYLSGNTGWIACNLEETLQETSSALSEIMTTDLIYMRNQRMVERMLPELQRGNAFVGIGALHLPGDEGVLSLLEKLGYEIEQKY
ncbi:TraB/GumN family protein [uncultured Sneathiella sp.]|uniref:TraB/GumN family protein n=1 Tax=uncultured Sneathiella sp. TaxID=879315 RepID=UPI0030EE02CC|tara:strand:+ start:9525 stop:10454 length:930 start_codon:yes stop_codon:yes gene_type:complete